MGYSRKKFNPADYDDIPDIMESMLGLRCGYQFDVHLHGKREEIERMAFRLRSAVNSMGLGKGYRIEKRFDLGVVRIIKLGKVTYELTDSVPVGETGDRRSDEPQVP